MCNATSWMRDSKLYPSMVGFTLKTLCMVILFSPVFVLCIKTISSTSIFIFLVGLRNCITSQVAEYVKAIHTAMQVCLETASLQ